ncbi:MULTISPECIES: hypothetical protein [Micromonospora]|uniref:Uncharacterized protein n=1 Tax=Micromonospora sicca TaxID=2202420 RepID=A0ABU5J701_9ACTN|nr:MULTISPECIES: hypothetical protein [unclassified Micromonospora]MBM0227279.1 hypothetical protein [Micromonospora sp. ATA51]MDZ5442981.1 hypothetical protein [Micromonospora sp. 4G57]MDZ5488308.1 hypothetical protein [Micromonospora sp. 4G53]
MNSAIGDRHMLAWQTKSTPSTICTPLVGAVAGRIAATAVLRRSLPDAEGLSASYGVAAVRRRGAAPGADA